jgi:hypothetical protein
MAEIAFYKLLNIPEVVIQNQDGHRVRHFDLRSTHHDVPDHMENSIWSPNVSHITINPRGEGELRYCELCFDKKAQMPRVLLSLDAVCMVKDNDPGHVYVQDLFDRTHRLKVSHMVSKLEGLDPKFIEGGEYAHV